jgi:REP element-mobilizing transposase RayT
MSRKLRYVPEDIRLAHITCRTIQGRYLFTPSPTLNDIVLGVLGRAQQKHPIRICEVVVASNHLHMLVDIDSVQQIADYMEYAGSNLAREINRLTGWKGPVFDRRYTMIPVSNEEPAHVEVLKYVLGHGVKEGLVERIVQWPGIHSGQARLSGEPLTGHWFSRKDEYAARRWGKDFDPLEYATEETVVLSPLPCWEHLPTEEYRERIRGLIEEVEEQAAADRERTGIPVLGPETILAQDPQHRPEKIAKSPAPFVHAVSKAVRLALYQAYS